MADYGEVRIFLPTHSVTFHPFGDIKFVPPPPFLHLGSVSSSCRHPSVSPQHQSVQAAEATRWAATLS